MAREYPVRTTLPPPVPRGRLLPTIEVLDTGDMPRWANGGVTWNPWPCRGMQAVAGGDPCLNPNEGDDFGWSCEPAVTQKPFRIYDTYHASTLSGWSGPGEIGDQVGDFLMQRGELMQSWAFARELANGGAGSTHTLKNTAHAPVLKAFGQAAVSAKLGIAILADELARNLRGGRGMIHMPPGLVGFADVKEPDDDTTFETKQGHKVVADAGYVDMPGPGGATAGAGEAWIYASGPVWYAATDLDLIGDSPNEYTNISRNTVTQWLDGYGLLVFDPCPVSAVLVTYS